METVADVRAIVADREVGKERYVGGVGGILADFVEGFGAIDGILLVVALGVVFVILLVVYRALILPFVVLFSAVLALGISSAAIYFCAKADLITVSGQSQGILFILAVGAATDYSLLLVARFRRSCATTVALRRDEGGLSSLDRADRCVRADRGPACCACCSPTCLASISGLGPVGAFRIAGAALTSLGFLPLVLVLLGRVAYWPIRPKFGSEHTDTRGLWGKLARLISRRTFGVWAITGATLLTFAGMSLLLNEEPIPQTDVFLTEVESVKAQD